MEKPKVAGRALLINIIIIGILLIGLAIWWEATRLKQRQSAPLRQATVLSKSIPIKPFELIDENNQNFNNHDLKGRWSLLFFGATHCQTTCSIALSKISKSYQLLKKVKARYLPKIVFISIDSDRDTTQAIKHYAKHFNKHFIGATGKPSELAALAKNLQIAYEPREADIEWQNTLKQDNKILVINPKGQWIGSLNPPFNAETITADYLKITRNHRQ
jgi:protein SCO1